MPSCSDGGSGDTFNPIPKEMGGGDMGRTRTPERGKEAGTRRRTALAKPAENLGVDEQRWRMIAEAAYYRAQARGFKDGDPIDDWLSAEREINRILPNPQQQRRELAAHAKLREEIAQRLAEVRDQLSADTVRDALLHARERLKAIGEHAADTVDKVAAHIEKDIIDAAHRMGPKWESFSDKTAGLFDVWRDRSASFLGRAAHAVSDWIHQAGQRVGPAKYHAGEIAAAGAFECTACGQRVELQTVAHLPPCPQCRAQEFRRLQT